MNRFLIPVAFAIGLIFVGWVGMGFVGSSGLALVMTAVIAAVYLLGAFELKQFRAATSSLAAALADIPQPLSSIGGWLERVHPSLQSAVRLRIEGERVGLPGPVLTPYLVGLLVMLGMLGTFLGMVVTFKGAVFALEGSADLQTIRSALAGPLKGLGLAFGTSVAGVAASAMLGLISAISRRERLNVARQLDSRIATVFRQFSRSHQREETFKALQGQARALPDVVERLHAMMEQIEHRNLQLNEQLTGRQAQFHRDVTVVYTDLADAVGASLKANLAASSRMAGESIKPVVEAAMTEIAKESRLLHERVSETAQAQLAGLGAEFSATARTVSDGWTAALQSHVRTSEGVVNGLDRALTSFTDTFEQRANALLTTVHEAATQSQANHTAADRQRLQAWTQALESMAATLHSEWQRVGAQTLAGQQAICLTLETTAGEISGRATEQASRAMDDVGRLLARSEALVSSRIDAETEWMTHQGDRMDQLAILWRKELGVLRDDEASRGQAAVERLSELQAALSRQLATLGAALEAPMSRLMQTAAEAPRAAADLIAQLRQEMTRLTERDNLALEERTGLMERISALLEATDKTSSEQRAAIESLVASAAVALDKAGNQSAQMLDTQADKATEMAAHVSASAIELSSLGESFHLSVKLFNDANNKLIDNLQRIEGAVNQSMERSDEQLAYYVGQAREVIDLSLTSQKAVLEDLRRLHDKPVAQTEESL